MTRRARVWLAGGVMAAAGGAVIAWLVLRGEPAPPAGQRAGATLAAGLAALAAEVPEAPLPCARLELASHQGERRFTAGAGARPFRIAGAELTAEPAPASGPRELVVAVLANARGAHADTLARLPALRAELERSGVELVVVAGGMAAGADELQALVEPLAADAPWPVWIVPGDREAPRAVAAVAGVLGDHVLDGARVRFAAIDGVVLASLPGVSQASRLGAGMDGCLHTRDDAGELVQALSAREGARVVVTHAPPRQRGDGASDLVAGGIHVGELDLAAALAAAPVELVLHADVGAAPGPATGAATGEGRATVHLGAPALDALPGPGADSGALIVRIGTAGKAHEPTVKWRRLRFAGAQLRPR